MYDLAIIEQINNSISLLDYAGQYLNFSERNGEYWTHCPFHEGDINPSFSINKDKNVFYCFGCNRGGSIIQFVMYYHNLSFTQAVKYLIDYANLSIEPKEKSETLNYLRQYKYKKMKTDEDFNREYLPDDYMNRFVKAPIEEWLAEGIKQEVLDEYEVRYDRIGNRIVFPIRNSEGKIIAIKGRTRVEDFENLGVSKYIYYQPIGTNNFLFGLYKNLPYIQEKNEAIIVEAEKGVLKLESWGFKNVIALSTSNINQHQKTMLISLKTNLTFAFDKDVSRKEIIKRIKDLALFTNVFYIFDAHNLLSGKESPYDRGLEIWNKLYTHYKYKIR